MKKLLLVLLFVPLVSLGQNDGYELCFELRNRSVSTNEDATKALQKILSVANLKTNRFVILPCDNIGNAMAAVYEGFRYILYKESWIDKSDYWSKMAILAHEVGHHINGHSLDLLLYVAEAIEGETLVNQRKQELEADEFAGFILAKLGATLGQASSGISLISSEKDDTYSTHPSKLKRLAAINLGFNKALEKENTIERISNKIRCSATTKAGTRCKRNASEGSIYCWQH